MQDKIKIDGIPEEYLDIVGAIGMETFLKLTLYITKWESLERCARGRDIRARLDGSNYRALAAQFRLCERQIRKIINSR